MASDDQLIQAFIQGDNNAFRSLVIKYQDQMFSVCMSILKNRDEAQEAAQDTFMKMHRAIGDFKAGSKFSSWLYKIAYRTSLDYIRKRKKTTDLDSINGSAIRFDESKTGSLENTELSDLLCRAMDNLPSDESALLRLFYLEELSIKELEEITGMSKSNVKVKLFRARKKMSDLLTRSNNEIEEFLYG
jgi:RNA polymerase sigma-70 factor (ECF subfamily)